MKNITDLIKNIDKAEDLSLETKFMNEVKTWDVFLFYKYYRDHKDEQNELQYAARTWVELHIVENIKPEAWETMIQLLKYVYAHTRSRKYEATIEDLLLDEIGSGRTAEARMLIKEETAEEETETEETETEKEEENIMTTLTEERREAIERLKELNTDNYYTDDVIEEIYEITSGLNISELEYDFEEVWDAEAMFEYIKEMSDDLDAIIYRLEDCSAGAKYYRFNGYGNFEDWTAEDLDWLVKGIIETIEQAE